jgi:RND family efflux transporter MFP subunit
MNLRSLSWRRAGVVGIAIAIASGALASRSRPLPVAVAAVERGTAIEAVYGTGTVEAEDRVEVKARVGGAVADIAVKVGQRVQRGDLLARIDASAAAFELERAEADLAAASAHAAPGAPLLAKLAAQRASLRADLDAARVELDRASRLGQAGVTATSEVDRARTRVLELESMLAANEADERSLRIDLAAGAAQKRAIMRSLASRLHDAEVRAPIDGVVLARRVEPGEVVAVNQPLFKIGDVDRLVLEVSVDEADVARVRDGSRGGAPTAAAISLYALPGRALRGHVFEVLPDANRDRKSFLVKVRLDEPEPALRSGMSAEVNLVAAARPDVLLVPPDAIDRGAVWIVSDGRARRANVTVGLRDLARVEVSGVREGDRVVLGDKAKLSEGARVAAAEAPRAGDKDAVKTAAR